MTQSPALQKILETNPALWLAYVSLENYRNKAMTADWQGDISKSLYYYDLHAKTCEFIWLMGYSTVKIGEPRSK
jgi:hypothetical protein